MATPLIRPPVKRAIERWACPEIGERFACSHGWRHRCGAPSPYKFVVTAASYRRGAYDIRTIELPRCAIHAAAAAARHGLQMPT